MQADLPPVFTGASFRQRFSTVIITLAACTVLFYTNDVHAATPPQIGVLLPVPDTSQMALSPLSTAEKNLLITLKQGKLRFSTMHVQELGSFKGNLIIIPVSDTTGQAILDAIHREDLKTQHFLIVPSVTKLSPMVQTFLKQAGLDVQGTQMPTQPLPLVMGGQTENATGPMLPAGSVVIDAKGTQDPLAKWGDTLPAAVYTPSTMLINWDWDTAPFSAVTLVKLLATWKHGDSTLVLMLPNQSLLIAKPEPAPAQTQPITAAPPVAPPELPVTPPVTDNIVPPATPLATTPSAIPVTAPAPAVPVVTQLPSAISPPSPTIPGKSLAKPASAKSTPGKPAKLSPQTASQKEFVRELDATLPQNIDVPAGGKLQTPASQPKKNDVEVDPQLSEYENGFKTEETATGLAPAGTSEYYNDRKRELSDLSAIVDQIAVLNPNKAALVKDVEEKSQLVQSRFENAWFSQNYPLALAAFRKSRSILMTSLLGNIAPMRVEARAIWMDRGSIIQCGNEAALRQTIDKLAVLGFNVIYFETINAGYPIYPSKLVPQNPQVVGWDPLAVALDEAHKDGIELHAWVWAFAVGNTRHNKLIGQPWNYPGPILSQPELANEMLLGKNGERLPYGQTEYWLSPASFKARAFLINLYSELVQNYAVDGLQFDYIRYPFQKPTYPAGYESFSTARFNTETGLDIVNQPSEFTFKAWDAWKAFQITSFVQETTLALRAIRPSLKLSAAVFPLPRHSRMAMIHQDWETWVKSGWLDTLSPMSYNRSARSLQHLVSYIHDSGEDKALVYPGVSLLKLSPIELLDTMQISQDTGVMGTTLFAVQQLNVEKERLLQSGPFQPQKTLVPHHDPLAVSQELIAETRTMVDGIVSLNLVPAARPLILSFSDALTGVDNALKPLKQTQPVIEQAAAIQQAIDSTKPLMLQADAWQTGATDAVTRYQATTVHQLAEKIARLVNYLAQQSQRTQQDSDTPGQPHED